MKQSHVWSQRRLNASAITGKDDKMKLSARNQFQGTVTKITEGQAMAEVTVKVGNLDFVAAITEGSVKSMGLKANDTVTVAVKATEVMIGK